jgi:hypothetical protein
MPLGCSYSLPFVTIHHVETLKALLAATQENHRTVMAALLEAGALQSTSDKRGFTPLIVAALQKDAKLTAALLAAPKETALDVNARGKFGNSALMTAAQEGHGARFQTEFCTRGCHWIPRLFALSEHACDQWHSSRESTCSYRCHHKLCRNTEGIWQL